jgi:hypothetical protein
MEAKDNSCWVKRYIEPCELKVSSECKANLPFLFIEEEVKADEKAFQPGP